MEKPSFNQPTNETEDRMFRKHLSKLLAVTLLACFWFSLAEAKAEKPPNVLFIAVDDLRPQLGCYDFPDMITPNIDRIAAEGMVFDRAYCQVAVCRASRVSLLLGVRPDTTEVWSNGSKHKHFRDHLPDVITLPQHFKNEGYHSQSFGKLYHGAFKVRSAWNDKASWSVPSGFGTPRYYYTDHGVEVARKVFAQRTKAKGAAIDDWVNHFVMGLSYEAPDVADNVLYDGQIADMAIEALGEKKDKPFFLALGFIRPHLPFIAPKKYWDMYPDEKVHVAENPYPPKNVPPVAMTNWGHPRQYYDFPKKGDPSDEMVLNLSRGYAACVTYVDAQIGRVLEELDRQGLRENTIVVFWGDHGWHTGENHIWGKVTNFEQSARAPLIVSYPGAKAKGKKTRGLVEFVDIYPTLCELADLPLPDHLEGSSFALLLDQPERAWKNAAFTQSSHPPYRGISMRTDRYRFSLWSPEKNLDQVYAIELYDHQTDPQENVNIAKEPENAELIKQLSAQLDAGWKKAFPPQE